MHIYRSWLFGIYILFFHLSIGHSQGVDVVITRADSLFDIGEYDNALAEYKRAIYFSDKPIPLNYQIAVGKCYYSMKDFPEAKNQFSQASADCKDDSLKIEIILYSAICDLENHNFYGALNSLNSICINAGTYLQRKIDFYLGVSYWGLNDYESAFKSFSRTLSDEESQKVGELAILKNENKRTLYKDPKLLPILSGILPGSGQFILGSYKEAATSTILCGGLAYLAIESILVLSTNVVFLNLWPWFFRYYAGGIQRTIEISEHKRIFKKNEVYKKALDIISATELKDFFDLEETREKKYVSLNGTSSGLKVLNKAYRIYKSVISPQDIMDCIYHPSCSTYALETVEVNGFLGILDAIDRLTRCHLFGHDSYPIYSENQLLYDPVSKIRQAERQLRSGTGTENPHPSTPLRNRN